MTAIGFIVTVFGYAVASVSETYQGRQAGAFVIVIGGVFMMSGVFLKLWELMP